MLWGLSWLGLEKAFPLDSDFNERGTFGDMFGSVNALFSGLALGGIIFSIFLQRSELRLQRKELKDTRKEFSKQNETMTLQKFETTFFNILRNHSELLESVPKRGKSSSDKNTNKYTTLKDLEYNTKYLIESIFNIIKSKKIDNPNYANHTISEIKKKSNDFDSVANSINIIIKFINTNNDFYYDLLLNSLSSSEKYLFGFYLEFNYIENNLNDHLLAKFMESYYLFDSIKKNDQLPPQISIGITQKKEHLALPSFQNLLDELTFRVTNNDSKIIEIMSVVINEIDRNGIIKKELHRINLDETVEPNNKNEIDLELDVNVMHILPEINSIFRLGVVVSLRKNGEDLYDINSNLYMRQSTLGQYSIQQ